jgi:tRNA 2-(methylsulfanyl)-N6-isopentenyladenosine37 hydroxylase
MSLLRSSTDRRWVAVALADLDRTLADHAHCEKKAAATAMKLVSDHPAHAAQVRVLARLAQEEQRHFFAVLAELARRGVTLPPDGGDLYVQRLLRLVRAGPERLLDRLVVSALIEARSCERLGLLGAALPPGRLRVLYLRLAQAEAGHEQLFIDLAARHAGSAEAQSRLGELAEQEAGIVAALPLLPRIH